jgi:hypothetical protein
MLTPWHLLPKWRPDKHKLLHFIAAFLDWNLWIKQSRASLLNVRSCWKQLKLLKRCWKHFWKQDVLSNDELSCERHLLRRWRPWDNFFTEVTHLFLICVQEPLIGQVVFRGIYNIKRQRIFCHLFKNSPNYNCWHYNDDAHAPPPPLL